MIDLFGDDLPPVPRANTKREATDQGRGENRAIDEGVFELVLSVCSGTAVRSVGTGGLRIYCKRNL